uniref:O-antigen ligase domain-containing protein n=1 Tax=Thermodesulfobacterium geofontis TaxID=1295609 RepID=A0A7C4JRJ5_9BACT
MSTLVKGLLIIESFLIILSPKGIKALIGYEGVYPNFHFIFMVFSLPVLLYCGAFDLKDLKSYLILLLNILLICSIYLLSTLLALIYTSVDPYFPISESIRQTLNYLLIFFPFLFLKYPYQTFIFKILVFLGVFEVLFVIYGILGFKNLFRMPEYLRQVIQEKILNQSWTIFGFIPKWGGTFPETQVLSTFLLMCFILLEIIKIKNWSIITKLLKLLFIVALLFLQSKSAILALIFYCVFKNMTLKNFYKIIIVFPFLFLVISFYPLVIFRKEILNQNLEALALQYSSFGERLFHIIKSVEFMSENIAQILFGLGPRVYGSLISQEYPGYFNEYTNAISVFNVLADIGFVGFIVFFIFLFLIFLKLKNFKLKIAYASILLSYLPQMAWGESFIFLFLAGLVNYDRYKRQHETLH